ncbi:antitoxin Xre-like helix-turn-helix domain-containing protein [Chryseobacterium sp. MDT2-18]|uniref:antitoxin Xre-like helix-turn-helix domain-containing protein n=1 Tax=Chryseobacterium sp. MDT2-18 TaxID=1259136 RepID=UPI00277DB82E|nr:antitoxin Xre-like helix-turn-helix domain-containing protein [Chryseobacterium sp. MDT2-18]MDQ0475872.1 putative toxin-antitoxin system antitoxin component (TIGR02293 family) [Chryseobacterium sp. MDT2-18]
MKTKSHKKESEKSLVSEQAVAYGNTSYRNFVFQNDYSLVKKAKAGIQTDVFYTFAESIKMPEKMLASVLNLSPRTISNYRELNKSLEPNHSEHLLKLIALFEKGKEFLGNIDEFNNWLEKPFWNSEEKPSDFLNTSGGVDLLIVRLERMAQGYPI